MSEDSSNGCQSVHSEGGSGSRHEQILETVGDPICTFDPDGQLGYVNAAFEQQTGYDASEAVGESLTLVFDDAHAQQLLPGVDARQTPDEQRTVEVLLRVRDGREIPVECNLTVAEGDEPHTVAVFRDITAHKAREERLSKFASVVSHDLRNPLDVALGRAEVLPEIADLDDENKQHLDEIYDSLKRMEHLIQDVLTLTRQGKEEIETEPIELRDVAQQAWETVETGEAALSVPAEATIAADRGRLLRLFENLFRNAIEHSDSVVTVEVGTFDNRAESGFYIADDGPGIEQEDHQKLFEGGYSTASEGTGLGLTIVREIAKAHGWCVGLGDASASNLSGAQFEITDVSPPVDAAE